jgi:hypothetical protein
MSTLHTVTLTNAKTGPNKSAAGTVLRNVIGLEIGLIGQRLFIQNETGAADDSGDRTKEFDLGQVTSITITVDAARTFSITVA